MTTPTQGQVRAWARAQGMTVNDRGSLPVSVTQAYALAHTKSTKGTTMTTPARKNAKKATARKATARKATARKATTRKPAKAAAKPVRARKAAPVRRTAAASAAASVNAPAAGSTDLAGGLRSYLGSIDTEVRAVSSLSEKIDGLVTELNDLRNQQAKRLIVLDTLRSSVSDKTLGSFLDQAIKPRKTRVSEVIPERLL